MHSNVLSTVVPICSLPSWHSKLLHLMQSSHHLLSSCTNASSGPPSLPKSTTLTLQPSKFANGLLPALTPSDHRLINTASLLHPCMLVSQLPCIMPFTRFGSPLQWYMSYPRTVSRYTPAMVLSTATQDDTCVNAVSNLLILFQMPQQPCHRYLPDPASLCHNLHQPNLHNQCNWHLLHPQCLQLQSHTSCPKGHPCNYACDIQCSPCAAQKMWSCSCGAQVPDTRDVTILLPMRGEPWLKMSYLWLSSSGSSML